MTNAAPDPGSTAVVIDRDDYLLAGWGPGRPKVKQNNGYRWYQPSLMAATGTLTADEREAIDRLADAERYGRLSVEHAWQAGVALDKVKRQAGHGNYRDWLAWKKISKSTAHRFVTLARGYGEMSQLGTFESVAEALRALGPDPGASASGGAPVSCWCPVECPSCGATLKEPF